MTITIADVGTLLIGGGTSWEVHLLGSYSDEAARPATRAVHDHLAGLPLDDRLALHARALAWQRSGDPDRPAELAELDLIASRAVADMAYVHAVDDAQDRQRFMAWQTARDRLTAEALR